MRILKQLLLTGAIGLVVVASCAWPSLSKTHIDKTAGLNGGFEVAKSGLPVNLLFNTTKTVPSGDFDILLDPFDPKEGRQSLKFVVRQCSPKGGRFSPGFSQQFKAAPGETYTISFWAKNDACDFLARVGGVSSFDGKYLTLARSSERIESWRRFETNFTIPAGMTSLRFELGILQPGTFHIDDLKVEKTQ